MTADGACLFRVETGASPYGKYRSSGFEPAWTRFELHPKRVNRKPNHGPIFRTEHEHQTEHLVRFEVHGLNRGSGPNNGNTSYDCRVWRAFRAPRLPFVQETGGPDAFHYVDSSYYRFRMIGPEAVRVRELCGTLF